MKRERRGVSERVKVRADTKSRGRRDLEQKKKGE